jgi:hypothetical protein
MYVHQIFPHSRRPVALTREVDVCFSSVSPLLQAVPAVLFCPGRDSPTRRCLPLKSTSCVVTEKHCSNSTCIKYAKAQSAGQVDLIMYEQWQNLPLHTPTELARVASVGTLLQSLRVYTLLCMKTSRYFLQGSRCLCFAPIGLWGSGTAPTRQPGYLPYCSTTQVGRRRFVAGDRSQMAPGSSLVFSVCGELSGVARAVLWRPENWINRFKTQHVENVGKKRKKQKTYHGTHFNSHVLYSNVKS